MFEALILSLAAVSHNDTGVWVCQVRGGAGEVLEAVTRLQVVQEPTITAQTSQVDTSVPQFCHPYLDE